MYHKLKKSTVREMSKSEKGYVAGMLDGEGHLYIRKPYEGTATGAVRVRITEGKAVVHLKKITGAGNICSYIPSQRRKDGGQKKKVYEWLVQGRSDLKYLLQQVEPYLVIKKRQAQIVLEMEALKSQGINDGSEVDILRNQIAKLASH